MINTRLSVQLPFLSCPKQHAEAGRHLLQTGQAVEDALRHLRQLVCVQIKLPVGMPNISRRIQPIALCVPAVSPWMGDIAIGTTCTRTILKYCACTELRKIKSLECETMHQTLHVHALDQSDHFYASLYEYIFLPHSSVIWAFRCMYCACVKVWTIIW